MESLREQASLRVHGGNTVSSTGVHDYTGDVGGVSIFDAPSVADALAIVQACPGISYGWTFEVFHE